jgi:hypothetical protein
MFNNFQFPNVNPTSSPIRFSSPSHFGGGSQEDDSMYVTDPKFALTNAELSPQAQNNNNIFNSPPQTQFGSPQINSPMFNSPMGNQSLFNFTTTPSPQTSRPAQFSIHDLQQRMQQQQEDELYRELQPLEIDPSEIRLVQPIGEGYFGAVYKGTYF